MRLYKLNQTVLSIKGNAEGFLKGLTSNSLEAPFNAFVNLHGRIIATFRQKKLSDEEIQIVVPPEAVSPLSEHLRTYAKISGVKIEDAKLNTYVDIDSGEWLLKSDDLPSQISKEEFIQYRLEKNLPLQGVDYQADEFILNVDSGQFVSFTKGCFLGQEPVAKVHNRSKPSKKLLVKLEDQCSEEEKLGMTSKLHGRGFVFVSNK